MSSATKRNLKSDRQSLFFRDLATPVSLHRTGGRFASTGQAAAVSALWRENFGGSEPPPPPFFTLEDRVDFSPEPALGELPTSPEFGLESRTPQRSRGYLSSPSSLKNKVDGSGSALANGGSQVLKQQQQQSPGSSTWWSPARVGENDIEENGRGSPVDGVVQQGWLALITLPPPREVVRPEMQRNSSHMGGMDEEEWVTVYGFPPGDTNLILREFEKCGTILNHVPGPRDANWMHILYQNRYDAQRALGKNGTQINSVLIVGVKAVDPVQRLYLHEMLTNSSHGSFMNYSFTPRSTFGRMGSSTLIASDAGTRLKSLPNGGSSAAVDGKGQRSNGAIASPAKSMVSKFIDLMFGM
ncbi:hypothetical protein AXF42_Ash005284 [Apostasia shenzhenica]|uniref:Nuclear pore complex protein NUP35 n=1 Tax=Apostasia shenzhenica TaxID=1088818 RepID=A0A2I0B6G2_9ASPA|nr:hypothetical protein AXF42_Ash005284 [Apostasia shenzhenica]